ncbi:hypothetical protein MP478_22330 [Chryseobacterium sp. WG14]|uniref:hypothetical protein n=1 Tax=Chryseobacterium sp. WG14 TaxID=2926909 RepID=UPI00211F36DE|nr:hypothetical protein [Chryseobacterium sp. WG14]MCQ9642132.1 hypothetical protein [Chryseobacterium sp. WG14]
MIRLSYLKVLDLVLAKANGWGLFYADGLKPIPIEQVFRKEWVYYWRLATGGWLLIIDHSLLAIDH